MKEILKYALELILEKVTEAILKKKYEKFFVFLSKVYTDENVEYFSSISKIVDENIIKMNKIEEIVKDCFKDSYKDISEPLLLSKNIIEEEVGMVLSDVDIFRMNLMPKSTAKRTLILKKIKEHFAENGIEFKENLVRSCIENSLIKMKAEE